jgi:adenylate cyclase
MKRKIAAIFAADIAGYSRLVAEDEEETLRRLASYRQVTDDFIAKGGGRIFNTAGDAVLAEFPSAVEAVRCAIDIQESLRTRNMAYPPSRQMAFRIGITIGDVVERDGDLLGDGVNIAARLEGLAEVGGICVSRAVHEQVANKLSVQFADIGAQEVKNIPTPVHAFMVAMRREDGTYATPQVKKPVKAGDHGAPNWMWPVAVTVICLAAIGVGGFLYFTKLETTASRPPSVVSNNSATAPASAPSPAPSLAPNGTATPQPVPTTTPQQSAAVISPIPPVAAPSPSPSSPPSASPTSVSVGKLVVTDVPFINHQVRNALNGEYLPAGEYKAFALNFNGNSGLSTRQPSEEAARNAATELCQKRADNVGSPNKCEVYAVGDNVVYPHGKPPMPPPPWIKHDPATERPFAADDVPLVRDPGRTRIDRVYVPGRRNKALALGPGGGVNFFILNAEAVDDAVRRSLESCGAIAGAACVIAAVNDDFVVPIPTTLKAIGLFNAADTSLIAPEARADAARRLADAASGWNAVAVGAARRPGLGLKQASEQAAANAALSECARRDSDCRVVAIGPFTVGPN